MNNRFQDLYVHDVDSGIRTSDSYFDAFDSARVFQPRVSAFIFATNSNSITCNNCSTLSMAPGAIGLEVHNSGAFVFGWGNTGGNGFNDPVSGQRGHIHGNLLGKYWKSQRRGMGNYRKFYGNSDRRNQFHRVQFWRRRKLRVAKSPRCSVWWLRGTQSAPNVRHTTSTTRQIRPSTALISRVINITSTPPAYDPATIFSFSGKPDSH